MMFPNLCFSWVRGETACHKVKHVRARVHIFIALLIVGYNMEHYFRTIICVCVCGGGREVILCAVCLNFVLTCGRILLYKYQQWNIHNAVFHFRLWLANTCMHSLNVEFHKVFCITLQSCSNYKKRGLAYRLVFPFRYIDRWNFGFG